MNRQAGKLLVAGLLILVFSTPATAQFEENLSAYDPTTVEGYLKPLQGAVGQALNTSFFTSAAVPQSGFHARLDLKLMSVFIKDSDRSFNTKTGGDFVPLDDSLVEVPTVVGSGEGVTVIGEGGTQYAFPGGLDLGSLSLVVPQITVGAVKGTEVYFRWLGVGTKEEDIGTVKTFGIGGRHSISQYFSGPVDLAGAVFYQKLTVEGDTQDKPSNQGDLVDVGTFSIGAQASSDVLPFLRVLGALSYDTVSMSTTYLQKTGSVDQWVTSEFDSEGSLHFSLGLFVGLGPVGFSVSGDLASRTGIAFNLGAGF